MSFCLTHISPLSPALHGQGFLLSLGKLLDLEMFLMMMAEIEMKLCIITSHTCFFFRQQEVDSEINAVLKLEKLPRSYSLAYLAVALFD